MIPKPTLAAAAPAALRKHFVRLTGGLAAFVVAGLSAAWAGAHPLTFRTVRLDALRLTYPSRFHIRNFRSCNWNVSGARGACVRGIFISEAALPAQPELGAAGFEGSIGFELVEIPREVVHGALLPAEFPLSRAKFTTPRGPYNPLDQREFAFNVRGENFALITWRAPEATARDRTALGKIVASLRLN